MISAFLDGDLARAEELTQRSLELGPVVGDELAQHAHAAQISGIYGSDAQCRQTLRC